MNVLMVSTGVFPVPSPYGGTETHIYWLANYLAKLGHRIDLVADPGEAEFHENITVHPIGADTNRERPDDFWTYIVKHFWGGVRAARLARKLLEDQNQTYDFVHVHGRWAPFILSMKRSVPFVFTMHDSPPPDDFCRDLRNQIVYRYSYKILNQGSAKRADMVIAVARDIEERLIDTGVSPDAVTTIPSGVATDIFTPDVSKTPRSSSFLFVGSLIRRKGVESLIRALPLVDSNWKCEIVGDGPQRSHLEQLVRSLDLGDRVHFRGNVPMEQMPETYAQAGAFVLPSLSEGTPIALLEAMSSGCPVIATNVSGIPNVLASREEGLLVEPDNPSGLAQAMNTLAANSGLRSQMGVAAREKILADYGWTAIALRVSDAYRQVLRNSSRSVPRRAARGEVLPAPHISDIAAAGD